MMMTLRRRWVGAASTSRGRVTPFALATACAFAGLWPCPDGASAAGGDSATPKPVVRVEARSADLLAVGIVHGERMTIHLSHTVDNAPLRDAVLTVLLRGVVHPTTAQADGGYSLETQDLALPGAAALVFRVSAPNVHEDLTGALEIAGAAKDEDKNSARQLGWWVLNFAVCIGFLLLLSRRRKAAAAAGEGGIE